MYLHVKDAKDLKLAIDVGLASQREIILENIIEYFEIKEITNFISQISSKLRHHGKLIIITNDIRILSKAYLNGQITLLDLNNILFYTNNESGGPLINKRCCLSLAEIEDLLNANNLSVIEKKYDGYQLFITAERP